jgi:hypothetical protein
MAYCGNSPGMCGKRADCADRHCPGRQMALDDAQLAGGLRALHTEDGGSWITDGFLRLRPAVTCSVCGGNCPCPQACTLPVAAAAPAQPITGRERARRLFQPT